MFIGQSLSFFVDQKYAKERRGPKVSKSACPYLWIQII